MKEEIIVQPTVSQRPAQLRRISWQAIIGGIVITLALQLLLTVLGISIGVTVAPSARVQSNLAGNAGLVAGIWLIIISIISLFFGGWVSGRMSGLGRKSEGALHGFVTWGAATLLTVCLLTSAAGGMLSGMGKLWSQVLPMGNPIVAGQAEFPGGMGVAMNNQQIGMNSPAKADWSSIRQEARSIAQKNATTPTGRSSDETSNQSQGAASQLISSIDRMFSHGGNINQNDREAVVNLLVTQDNMNRDQANQTVDKWIQTYKQSRTGPAQNSGETSATVLQTALAAGWGTFIALVLGLIAAMWGGSIGTASFLRTRETVTVAAA